MNVHPSERVSRREMAVSSPSSRTRLSTNGKVTGHKVEAHSDLLAEFPYLGPPHNV
jgi:hypothetical protein